MKRILAIFLFAIFLGACGSSDESANTLNNSPNSAGNVATTNSNLVPYQVNVNPEAANGKPNANMETINRDDPKNKTKFEERPAPDNSVFVSKLDAKGYTGTRTFKDHPILLKIEQTQKGKEKKLKVYLKTGKVFDVSEKRVPNFRTNAPATILKAIGMEPNTGQSQNAENEKKSDAENERN